MPKDERNKPVDRSPNIKAAQSNKSNESVTINDRPHKADRTLLIAAIVILILAILMVAFSMARYGRLSGYFDDFNWNNRGKNMTIRGSGMPHFGGNIYIEAESSENSSSQIVISGVVVSKTGDNFEIAGSGNRTTVKTTDDTTYNNSKKEVSVNDSVVVYGSKSNDVITASDIRINNL